ncbi:MAG: protein kinase [Pirellulaceae bacterium]
MIGKYRLLQLIGEGGMGRVFMAEQIEDVRRKVALKVIKLGMDTRQVIARFEAERQALAMFDHPNITKVLDAGMTTTRTAVLCHGIGAGRATYGFRDNVKTFT